MVKIYDATGTAITYPVINNNGSIITSGSIYATGASTVYENCNFVTSTTATATVTIIATPTYYTCLSDCYTAQYINEPTFFNETPEEIARQVRIELQEQEQERERRKIKKALRLTAEQKANQLLIENLNEAQRLQYERFGYFFVTGQSGKRYRIKKGRNINIDILENRKVVKRLCAHPEIDCPNEDTMLIQKIMLEHNEQHFLNVANEWPI